MSTRNLAPEFARAAVRLESDGVHWTGTFARVVHTALEDLVSEAPVDVIVRRHFGQDDREAFVEFTASSVNGQVVRGTDATGNDVAIVLDMITGLAF